MSHAGDDQIIDPRFLGPRVGVVVERDDPEQLGRVRVRVPGLVEPASAWARPFGTGWGGSTNMGAFGVPAVGAEVVVFFEAGDVDAPLYTGGYWGLPDGESEVPLEARKTPPDAVVLATEHFRIEVDQTEGERRLRLTNLVTGDNIILDAERNSIMIAGTTLVRIESEGAIELDAPVVTIAGRAVEVGIEREI